MPPAEDNHFGYCPLPPTSPRPQGRLQGQTALLTGVCSAVGQQLAIEFAKCGANVVLIDQRVESGIRERLKGIGTGEERILTMTGELGSEKTRENVVEKAIGKFGRIDFMVNLVYSRAKWGKMHNNPFRFWGELRSLAHLENLVHPHLAKTRGKIFNIFDGHNEEQENLFNGFCAEMKEKCVGKANGKGGIECQNLSISELEEEGNAKLEPKDVGEYIFYKISGKARLARLAAHFLLIFPSLILAFLLIFWGPIPQSPAYHDFADQRILMDHLRNTANVISSFGFSLVGLFGLLALILAKTTGGWPNAHFVHPIEFYLYQLFFALLIAVGLGSAYYHIEPRNETLIWDRLPMAALIATLLAAFLVERVSVRFGILSAIPLLLFSIGATFHWYLGEMGGHGDLRLYIFVVQVIPLLIFPLLLFAYPSPFRGTRFLVFALIFFAIARIAEIFDRLVFNLSFHFLSGHFLKHIFATISLCLILAYVLLREKRKHAKFAYHLNGLRWASKNAKGQNGK